MIDAGTFLHGLEFPESLPPRAALLTFDDGYRSVRHIVLPVLRAFHFPAVLFVPTGFIGSINRFDADVEPAEPICNWDDLREFQRAGVSIQSHGVTHRRLSTLDSAELRREVQDSKALIQDHLGHAVGIFSFPYGDNGRDAGVTAEVLREAGYRAGFLYGGGANVMPPSDRYGLHRFAIGPDTDVPATLEND